MTEWTTQWSSPDRRLSVQSMSGNDGYRFHRVSSSRFGNGAVVVGTTSEGFLFVRASRSIVRSSLLELPRGQADNHDRNPVATARRELLEETGHRLQGAEDLGRIWPDSGLLADCVHVVRGAAVPARSQREYNELVWLDRVGIDAAIADGEIRDGITLSAWALVTALRAPGDS